MGHNTEMIDGYLFRASEIKRMRKWEKIMSDRQWWCITKLMTAAGFTKPEHFPGAHTQEKRLMFKFMLAFNSSHDDAQIEHSTISGKDYFRLVPKQ